MGLLDSVTGALGAKSGSGGLTEVVMELINGPQAGGLAGLLENSGPAASATLSIPGSGQEQICRCLQNK